jgi:F-type H+-transporting ATPase subunit b
MPQFDPSSYSSQLFWLTICFALLYFSMSKIFLPRIRDILKERNNVIEKDKAICAKLQKQIDEISQASKLARETSARQYNLSIEQSVKQAVLARDKALNDIKNKTSKMFEESQQEIKNLKENSNEDRQNAINKLVDELNKKLLGGNLS